MEVKEIPNNGGTMIVSDEKKNNYATKGHVNGIAIPALAIAGYNLLRSGGLGNLGGAFGGSCSNGAATNEITAKEAYTKECEDAVALTSAIYQGRITNLQEMYAMRNTDVSEKFGLYKAQTDADFALYKGQRDANDKTNERISNIENIVSVNSATLAEREKAREREKALEYALIQAQMDANAKQADFNLAARTCRMIQGEVVLPNTPTVTGLASQPSACCNFPFGQ